MRSFGKIGRKINNFLKNLQRFSKFRVYGNERTKTLGLRA